METPNEWLKVDISRLFDTRTDGDGRVFEPRKILIRGQAGVGKTTLCKKMVHDFTRHDMWKKSFDRILWIPLRNIKLLPPMCVNLQGLFQEEFFRNTPTEKEKFGKELYAQVHEGQDHQTLFILDGLDEVYEALQKDDKYHDLLDILLGMPACIVTSRPRVVLPDCYTSQFDLELETVRFYPEQVTTYIEKSFSNPQSAGPGGKHVEELQSLLQKHQLLGQLVRIPIQLDALCFIWETDRRSMLDDSQLDTMTSIYQAIMRSLWKRDLLRFNMEMQQKRLTQSDIHNMPLNQLESFFRTEVLTLEKLAFEGMVYNRISFEESRAMATPSSISSLTKPLSAGTLAGLSCLRTHDVSTDDPVYHFVHLTFQEYFAARFFVRNWSSEKPLLEKHDASLKSASNFVKYYKYDNQYDVFWRFVMGLFGLRTEGLIDFYGELQAEPLEILGPVHQRLLMHCLSEVSPSHATFTSERKKMEGELGKWGFVECRLGSARLAKAAEFPETSLLALLQLTPHQRRPDILTQLGHSLDASLAAQHLLCSWLNQDASSGLVIQSLGFLQNTRAPLDNVMISAVKAKFEDEDDDVQIEAIKVFGRWATMDDGGHVLEELETAARRGRSELTRTAAFEAMGEQRPLDQENVHYPTLQLRNALDKETENARAFKEGKADRIDYEAHILAIISPLEQQKHLPSDLLQDLLRLVQSPVPRVDSVARRALQAQVPNDTILKEITVWLGSLDISTQKAAVSIIAGWPQIPVKAAKLIIRQLDRNGRLPLESLQALRRWVRHDADISDAVAECLRDENDFDRCKAIELLKSDPDSFDKYVDVVKSQLQQHKDDEVQRSALCYLLKRLSFEDLGHAAISAWMNNPVFRMTILRALRERPELCPRPCLAFMKTLLELCSEDYPHEERASAFRILAKLHYTDDETKHRSFEALMAGLESSDVHLKKGAALELGKWPRPEYHHFKRAFQQFDIIRKQSIQQPRQRQKNKKYAYRSCRFQIAALLGKWSTSSDEDVLLVIAQNLLDPKAEGTHDFAYVVESLGSWPQPRGEIVDQICQGLQSPREEIRKSTLALLGNWPRLQPHVIQAIGKTLHTKILWIIPSDGTRLDDISERIQRNALTALANQQSLPLGEIEPYMEALYRASLQVSFETHLYWLSKDGMYSVVLGSRALRWKDKEGKEDTWFFLEPGTVERWRHSIFESNDSPEESLHR